MLAIIRCRVFCLPGCSKNLKTKIYRTIILPVVLYGCEAWSLTAREERKLRVFENMVLRIFGPRRDEVIGNGGHCVSETFQARMIKILSDNCWC